MEKKQIDDLSKLSLEDLTILAKKTSDMVRKAKQSKKLEYLIVGTTYTCFPRTKECPVPEAIAGCKVKVIASGPKNGGRTYAYCEVLSGDEKGTMRFIHLSFITKRTIGMAEAEAEAKKVA